MSAYPTAFTIPLQQPAPPPLQFRTATTDDIQRMYDMDVRLVRKHQWNEHCKCGKVTHLLGTSSSLPIRPIWEENGRCIFHSPYRHVKIAYRDNNRPDDNYTTQRIR